MSSKETPIHRETQTSPLRIPLILVVSGMMLFGAWQIREEQWQSALMIGLALIAGGITWGLTEFFVEVFPRELHFGFPIWRKRVLLDELAVGEVETIPFGAGMGIHFYRNRWVYNARLGRGVAITANKRNYLLGSDQPERLQAALLAAAKRRPGQ